MLVVGVDDDQQRRMGQSFGIIDFAAEMGKGSNPGVTELLSIVEPVKDDARGVGRVRVGSAIGGEGEGSRPVFQEDRALRGPNQLGPVARTATRVKEPDFEAAGHTTW